MGTLVKRKHSFCPFIWVALELELCLPSRSDYSLVGWACRASMIIGLPSISRLSHKRVSPLVLTLFKTLWYTLVLILLHDYICPWPDVHDVQLYMNPGLETKDHPFQFSLCKQVSYVLTSSSDAALATWQCVIYTKRGRHYNATV